MANFGDKTFHSALQVYLYENNFFVEADSLFIVSQCFFFKRKFLIKILKSFKLFFLKLPSSKLIRIIASQTALPWKKCKHTTHPNFRVCVWWNVPTIRFKFGVFFVKSISRKFSWNWFHEISLSDCIKHKPFISEEWHIFFSLWNHFLIPKIRLYISFCYCL